jgi:hypothetical protein
MKHTTITLAILAAGLAGTGVTRTAHAQDSPSYARIRSFTHGGSGCPERSVGANITADGRILTVLYDKYVATVGPAVAVAEKRKNCTLTVEMEFPQGFSFSVADVDFRGFADLGAGLVGTQRASYYFAGFRPGREPEFRTVLRGPYNDNYSRRDSLGLLAAVWSPCGAIAPLVIRTSVDINNQRNLTGTGLMSVDTTDLTVRQIYHLRWRRCPR